MAATEKILVITDDQGRVLAAQLTARGEDYGKEESPVSRLVALDGQRALHINIPREAIGLPGPDLHRYFSEVRIRSDGEVELPRINIKKMHQE